MRREEYYDTSQDFGEGVNKEFARRNEIIKEKGYYDPLEDIYEEIEKIVNEKNFGMFMTYDGNSAPEYKCSECSYSGDPHNIEHDESCQIEKLRSLVNTLGDMIT